MAEGDTVCQAASSPLGFAIAVLALGGSSLGRRRASAQALPLPACAACPQTTPLLQTTLQRSPQPLAVYPVPNSKVPQPDSATSSALTLSQPTCTLPPGWACLSTHTLPHWPAKRPLSILHCLQKAFLHSDLYKSPSQGHGSSSDRKCRKRLEGKIVQEH